MTQNQQVKDFDETRFVKFRTERDRTLPLPDLMLAALQVNIAAGRLPAPEADGRRYLKIPLNAFERPWPSSSSSVGAWPCDHDAYRRTGMQSHSSLSAMRVSAHRSVKV
jgi:hypothetical protein